jgi:hypothetical protein
MRCIRAFKAGFGRDANGRRTKGYAYWATTRHLSGLAIVVEEMARRAVQNKAEAQMRNRDAQIPR